MKKAKKNRLMNSKVLFAFKGVGILGFVVIGIFLYFLFKLDVLPIHYTIIIVVFFLVLGFGCNFAIFKFKNAFKIVSLLVIFMLSGISIVGIYYMYHTDRFLNQSFELNKMSHSTSYYVVAASDNEVDSLTNLSGEIAYYDGASFMNEAMEQLKSNCVNEISFKAVDDVLTMFRNVSNKKMNVMLIEKSNFNLVFQVDSGLKREDFKVIHEIDIYTKVDVSKEEIKGSFNVYIGGNDFTYSLMDFNMILSINMDTNKILLTSIPRDYYIPVSGYNGRRDTLSYMGARGIETNQKSLEEFLEIELDYFIKINTRSLVGIVDELEGINYCSDIAYTTTHALILDSYDDSQGPKLSVKKGCQKINGIQALTIARERKAFADGDRQRQKNCQQIFIAIFNKLKSMKTITNYNNILTSLSDLYETNIPREIITDLIKQTIDGANWSIESQSMDGTNAQGYVHLTNLIDYVMNPNMDSVNTAVNKIKNVLE